MAMFPGGGGIGGGGKGMLKLVRRSITRAGVSSLQEPISPTAASTTTNKRCSFNSTLSLSSPIPGAASTSCDGPASPTRWHSFVGSCGDDCAHDWVSVDYPETDAFPLGSVPSIDEVHSAVSCLTHVFDAPLQPLLIRDKFTYHDEKDLADTISSPVSLPPGVPELDWMEPSPYICDSRVLNPYGYQRVYDAVSMLQSEPSVQRMVISISSDPAVWDAVLSNKVVQELRDSYYEDADQSSIPSGSESCDEDSGNKSSPGISFMRWMLDNSKAKVVQVMEMITKLVNELFKPHAGVETTAGATHPFEEKVRASFMLSVMVLLIVVVTRLQKG